MLRSVMAQCACAVYTREATSGRMQDRCSAPPVARARCMGCGGFHYHALGTCRLYTCL